MPVSGEDNGYYTTLTWKKGKSSIEVIDYPEEVEQDIIGSIVINIKDKNGSLCGVKVGMKKEDGSYTASGKATGGAVSIRAYAGPYMPINIELKDGKVTSIYWMRS